MSLKLAKEPFLILSLSRMVNILSLPKTMATSNQKLLAYMKISQWLYLKMEIIKRKSSYKKHSMECIKWKVKKMMEQSLIWVSFMTIGVTSRHRNKLKSRNWLHNFIPSSLQIISDFIIQFFKIKYEINQYLIEMGLNFYAFLAADDTIWQENWGTLMTLFS